MKNLLILFLMIAFGFAAHAQLASLKNAKPVKPFALNKMEVKFSNFDELKQFKERIAIGKSGIEKFPIDRDFKFIYSVAKSSKLADKAINLGGIKVEITDQPDKTSLIKEINDSIDGLLEIIALGN